MKKWNVGDGAFVNWAQLNKQIHISTELNKLLFTILLSIEADSAKVMKTMTARADPAAKRQAWPMIKLFIGHFNRRKQNYNNTLRQKIL